MHANFDGSRVSLRVRLVLRQQCHHMLAERLARTRSVAELCALCHFESGDINGGNASQRAAEYTMRGYVSMFSWKRPRCPFTPERANVHGSSLCRFTSAAFVNLRPVKVISWELADVTIKALYLNIVEWRESDKKLWNILIFGTKRMRFWP